jgi:branched-chain amino acid transport system permease protein
MYDASTLLQFLISGITVGCIYGLVGIGFTVIYNASSVVNFAQGAFVMLGGMITSSLRVGFGWPYWTAIAAAVVIVCVIAFGIQKLVCEPLIGRRASAAVLILATLACQLILENVTLQIFGYGPRILPLFTPGEPIKFLGVAVSLQTPWIVLVSLAACGLLAVLYRYTLVGKAMRACAINMEVAQLLGIRVNRIVALAFAISGALGALAGILLTPLQYTSFSIGITFALNGFIAAVAGGFGNAMGAFAGGIILGIVQSIAVVYIDSGYKNVVAFSALITLLLVRPQGLFKSFEAQH